MKLKFLGSGSAFTMKNFQTNMILTADSGKKMLIDCGTDIRFSLEEAHLNHRDIDAVYISHCHADHIGGLEWLAFYRYFDKGAGGPPKLYMVRQLMHEAWEHTLKGGLESIEGKVMNLTDYFVCRAVDPNEAFDWEGIYFQPIQTVHIVNGFKIMNSFGLQFCKNKSESPPYFLTTDTQFAPSQMNKFYYGSRLVFQDAEIAPYKSGVHAHISDLVTLSQAIKKKMWLCHCPDLVEVPPEVAEFAGLVKKGQEFELE